MRRATRTHMPLRSCRSTSPGDLRRPAGRAPDPAGADCMMIASGFMRRSSSGPRRKRAWSNRAVSPGPSYSDWRRVRYRASSSGRTSPGESVSSRSMPRLSRSDLTSPRIRNAGWREEPEPHPRIVGEGDGRASAPSAPARGRPSCRSSSLRCRPARRSCDPGCRCRGGLGRVLIGAAPRRDDRHRAGDRVHHARRPRGEARLRASHDDDVHVGAERADAVLEALSPSPPTRSRDRGSRSCGCRGCVQALLNERNVRSRAA